MTGAPAARDVRFPSSGARCAAWHFRPTVTGRAPVVVLGHGFGATRAGGLARYAERFARAGFHALAFDYRHFGDSEGAPRQVLDIDEQLGDWASAVTAARALEGVDRERVALWGSSFAGGHVVEVAARDPRVAAVVSQVPHLSGLASALAGSVVAQARIAACAIADRLGALRGREPVTIPIVGPPGSLAMMTTPDAEPGYRLLYGDEPFVNAVAARVALRVSGYSPLRIAENVRCPLLVQVATRDRVTPPAPARALARRAPDATLLEYDCGHFDVYGGEMYERVVADQVAFLARALDWKALS